MKMPAAYLKLMKPFGESADVTIRPVPDYALVYPPVGFFRWPICSLGNGDDYGYYWPVGREDADPIVALMSHDCGTLNPISSSTEALAREGTSRELTALMSQGEGQMENSEEDEPERELPTLEDRLRLDDRSPYLLVANADVALARNDVSLAESMYLKAVELLPEYTAAHFGLAMLYRRTRRPAQAISWMLEVIRSPLSFCGASFWADTSLSPDFLNRTDYRRKCLMWLQQTRGEQAPEVEADPLFQARHRLTLAYGVTTNDDYHIYEDAIESYVNQGRITDAVRLTMTYGDLMICETTPFRERYNFTPDGFRQRLKRLFRLGNLDRRLAFLKTPTT